MAKKKKRVKLDVPLNIWNDGIYVDINSEHDDVIKDINDDLNIDTSDLPEPSLYSTARYIFIEGYHVIWLKNFNESELLHECMHCIFQLLRNIGLPLTSESEEAYTYTTQYLFDEIKENYKLEIKRK